MALDNSESGKTILRLPFYIFSFKREFNEINADEGRVEALAKVFENIADRLDRELDKGDL